MSKASRWERSSFIDDNGLSITRYYGSDNDHVFMTFELRQDSQLTGFWGHKSFGAIAYQANLASMLVPRGAAERNEKSWQFLKDMLSVVHELP